jgi:hypothetical protein
MHVSTSFLDPGQLPSIKGLTKYVVFLSSVTVLDQTWPQISCTGAYHGFLEDPSDHLL